jgi:ankyrin repeat protein
VCENTYDSHCDVNVQNNTGDTALILAASNGHSECVKLLIDNYCDVNVINDFGDPALTLATSKNHSECVKILTDNRCNVYVMPVMETLLLFVLLIIVIHSV